MKPRASAATIASICCACETAPPSAGPPRETPPASASSGVMSRNRIPGLGKSGMSRMNVLRSSMDMAKRVRIGEVAAVNIAHRPPSSNRLAQPRPQRAENTVAMAVSELTPNVARSPIGLDVRRTGCAAARRRCRRCRGRGRRAWRRQAAGSSRSCRSESTARDTPRPRVRSRRQAIRSSGDQSGQGWPTGSCQMPRQLVVIDECDRCSAQLH